MTLARGLSRTLFALVVIALLCVAIIVGAPIAARQLTLHYLANAGVDAHIGNVDVDLFTGTLAYDDIEGHSQDGGGFAIGHLAVSLNYVPLLSHRISLSRLTLADATVDVRRTADNALRVGGIQVLPSNAGSTNWGWALQQIRVDALHLHYSQPAIGDAPAIDRELVFHHAGARDLVSWQQDNDTPVDTQISLGAGRIGLKGRIIPFGQKLTARFELTTENLALDQLAPLARAGGLRSLAGTLDSQQRIDIEYARGAGLSIAIDGKAGWRNSRLALSSGPGFTSDRFAWQGQLTMRLPGAGSDAVADTDALDARMARGLRLAPPASEPQRRSSEPAGESTQRRKTGDNQHLQLRFSSSTGLATAGTHPQPAAQNRSTHGTIDIDGHIQVDGFAARQPDGFKLTQKHGNWQGKLRVMLSGAKTRIEADSTLTADTLKTGLANGSSLDAGGLAWQGHTDLTLAPGSTRLATAGDLDASGMRLALAGSAALDSERIQWHGKTLLDTGDPLRQRASGRLVTRNVRFTLAHSPLELGAANASFDGSYELAPGAAAQADILTSDGTFHAENLAVSRPGTIDMHQDTTDWRGKTTLTLGTARTRIATDGNLNTSGMHLALAGSVGFDSTQVDWQGQTTLAIGEKLSQQTQGRLKVRNARISLTDSPLTIGASTLAFDGSSRLKPGGEADRLTSDGKLHLEKLAVSQPDGLALRQNTTDWHGQTTLTLGTAGKSVNTDGTLTAESTTLNIPGVMRLTSRQSKWRGNTILGLAGPASRHASGRFDLDGARLDLATTPLAFNASHIAFDGTYRQPSASPGAASTPRLTADVDAQHLRVTNTAIDADWAAAREAHADNLLIEGIDAIRLRRLETRDFVLLRDNSTPSAIMRARHATARAFSLDDLRTYHFGALDITGAQIHIRRNEAGMGVAAQFLSDDKPAPDHKQSARKDTGNRTTFTVDSARVSSPSMNFIDTTVTPAVRVDATHLDLVVSGLNTARPSETAKYQISADVGRYAHIDSFGGIAPFAPKGVNMNLVAYLRSLALAPLSGYLNAAMNRRIERGVANGSLTLKATDGQLNGKLDVTLSNFRLANRQSKRTEIAYGISMSTALRLVRTNDDNIDFTTLVLGDLTYPQFSISNLVREAVLAGLRTALTSSYSPVGLLNQARRAIFKVFTTLSFRAVTFQPGLFYVQPKDRPYLSHVVTAMNDKPKLAVTITGYARPEEAASISPFSRQRIHRKNLSVLESLAQTRAEAVRDYIAARGIKGDRLTIAAPVVDRADSAQPRATLSIH